MSEDNPSSDPWASLPSRRVAIVDDDEKDAQVIRLLLEDLDLNPIIFEKLDADLKSMARRVRDSADVVVCDHRLSVRSDVAYTGAALVADLTLAQFPAVLVTQFNEVDCQTTLRLHRRQIPVVLPRQKLGHEELREGLSRSIEEATGTLPSWRRPWRTLVQVVGRARGGSGELIEALLPGWRAHEVVQFPLELIPPGLRDSVKDDMFLFASVNVGAESASDLYLTDFEMAPSLDSEDDSG